jgi:hypothetical protein
VKVDYSMSETSLLKTDSPPGDESVPSRPHRIRDWFSRNRWYLAGSFLVLMLARAEAKRAETPQMQANRQAIEQMSRVERDRLRHNQQQFQDLSKDDRQRLQTIHTAVQDEPQLDETMSQFHAWLATLPLQAREKLLQPSSAEDRLQMMQHLMASHQPPTRDDEFNPATDNAARSPFSVLRVSPSDYEDMIRAGAEWAGLPATPDTNSVIGRLEHHVIVVSGIMDRVLPSWRTAVNRSGTRPRPDFPDELRRVLLSHLSDPNQKRAIQSRPASQQNLMAMTLLARGLFDEARRVIKSLGPTDAELDRVLRDIPEARRKFINRMPRELSDRLLQQQWLSRRLSPHAGESLSRLWSLFERLLNRQTTGQQNGTFPNRQRFDGADIPRSNTASKKKR